MHSKLWAINRITRSLDYNAMVALILHIWIVCCMVCCSEKPIRLQLLKNIWQSCSLYSIIKLLNACVGLVVPGSRLPHISMRSRPFACTQLSSPWQPYSCRPAWRHQKKRKNKEETIHGQWWWHHFDPNQYGTLRCTHKLHRKSGRHCCERAHIMMSQCT